MRAPGGAPHQGSVGCAVKAPDGSAGGVIDGGSVPGNTVAPCGGAGGGGGAGWIILRSPALTIEGTVISPQATLP
jgi:hypothetical protein